MKSSAVLLALLSGLVSAGVAQVRAASGTGTGTSTGTDAIASTNTNTKTTPPWAQPPKSQSRSACRCFPGDACWPSAATWKSFNDTVGGRLIATVPLASPCHHDAFAPYDAGACQSLQAQWFSPALHEESPSSIMAPYFTNNSCNPFLPPDAPCVVGSYVSYSVNVAGPQDVARTLWFANYFNIRIVVKNTGHDYSGKSTGAGAIGIWTHNLAGVSFVDYQSDGYTGKAVRAAAGVQMSQVYDSASAVGLAVVGGESASVGYVGGYTQGGGHSAMSSRYGLAADQVLEWEVVDGRGRILKATPKENPDLYWALCGGGGGTYGVVTSMTSKAYPDVPVVGANVSFASAGVTQDQFYDVLSTFQASLPDIVDAGAMAVWFFSNESFALSPVTAPGLTEDKVKQLLKPLTDKLDSYNMTYGELLPEPTPPPPPLHTASSLPPSKKILTTFTYSLCCHHVPWIQRSVQCPGGQAARWRWSIWQSPYSTLCRQGQECRPDGRVSLHQPARRPSGGTRNERVQKGCWAGPQRRQPGVARHAYSQHHSDVSFSCFPPSIGTEALYPLHEDVLLIRRAKKTDLMTTPYRCRT